jgi:hypothetical protein
MPPLPPELIRTYHPLVERDLIELESRSLQLRAIEIIRAISCGEIRGQRLENNERIGDLSGYFKIYFDESSDVSPRFRIVYQLIPDSSQPRTLKIIVIGERNNFKVYSEAIRRI